MFRKAVSSDLDEITQIYVHIHEQESQGKITTGWIAGVYPVRETAEKALEREDLFVLEEDGKILASAIINQVQVDVYADCAWTWEAPDHEVMVLHTLVVEPSAAKQGIGTSFVGFYEAYARENGCTVLRMDTNARNTAARTLYAKLGYQETDIVPCVFNGIPDVQLVLLEKSIR